MFRQFAAALVAASLVAAPVIAYAEDAPAVEVAAAPDGTIVATPALTPVRNVTTGHDIRHLVVKDGKPVLRQVVNINPVKAVRIHDVKRVATIQHGRIVKFAKPAHRVVIPFSVTGFRACEIASAPGAISLSGDFSGFLRTPPCSEVRRSGQDGR